MTGATGQGEFPSLPSYRALFDRSDAPPGSAWGLFGRDDRVGTVNLLTSERVAAAATLVRRGRVHSLNWSLAEPDPPLFHRRAPERTALTFDHIHDDHYSSFYPQSSSQWDALAHVDHPTFGGWNGLPPARGATIESWARRGIVGRFVLIDVPRHRESLGKLWDPGVDSVVSVSELDDALAATGVSIQDGDILLIRSGWIAWWQNASAVDRQRVRMANTFPGLCGAPETSEWLWDHHVAAVATDAPSVEVLPIRSGEHLHPVLLSLLGIAVGELFDLESLAQDCFDHDAWVGLFTAAPLHLPGGYGSTANALALM